MKENIEQMKERHRKEIEELENNCKHEKISEWVMSLWAPGHIGPNIKYCEFCGKVMETQPTEIVTSFDDFDSLPGQSD
jgi:hypothetical protein